MKEILKAELAWKTKKFSVTIEKELVLLKSVINLNEKGQQKELIVKGNSRTLITLFNCPVCEMLAGARTETRYFSKWSEACSVQVANLLYETGIILYTVTRSLPDWAKPEYLGTMGQILKANINTQEITGLSECPLCGRFTNCLYGTGTKNNPCRCRWCFDRGADSEIIFTVDKNLEISFEKNIPASPLSKEIIPFSRPRKEDKRPPLTIDISLPVLLKPVRPDEVILFWKNILNNKKLIRSAFKISLNNLLKKEIIKHFTDLSEHSYYWDNPFKKTPFEKRPNELGLNELTKTGFYQIAYVSFEVALPNEGKFRAPSQRIPEDDDSFGFIRVEQVRKNTSCSY